MDQVKGGGDRLVVMMCKVQVVQLGGHVCLFIYCFIKWGWL